MFCVPATWAQLGEGKSITWGKCGRATASRADFDGDRRTDLSVYRPSENNWYILRSEDGFMLQSWGLSGDIVAPADYDCDGKTDMTIFRPSDGTWHSIFSRDNSIRVFQWGLPNDVPVPADYDGDKRDDFAVWRPSDGRWYILDQGVSHPWGLQGDRPVPGDYNGDGKADLAVWRWWAPWITSKWYFSINGDLSMIQYPVPGVGSPVPADYDGDGTTDLALVGPDLKLSPKGYMCWRIRLSGGGEIVQPWGLNGDTPVPGDFDGDGIYDLGVFRPSEGRWYLLQSTAGMNSFSWGLTGDEPIY